MSDSVASLAGALYLSIEALVPELVPMSENLAFGFATIILTWIGIRIMMERDAQDQTLMGDVLKLFLTLGIVLGILQNYSELFRLLNDSANYICIQLGAPGGDPTDVIAQAWNIFVKLPSEMVEDIANSDPDGIWGWVKERLDVPTAASIYAGILGLFGTLAAAAAVTYVAFAVTLFAMIAIMGPICLPFLMLPKLDKIFWSWLDAMLYALVVKIFIFAVLAVMGKVFPTSLPSLIRHTPDGDVFDLKVLGAAVAALFFALAVIRSSFTVAGLVIGVRLNLKPEFKL
ncbi:MAG: type IV secretion system protein [Candidatus Thiodiazotropha lotti]|nr:type IV secretion system protein [Candidatus Thiodiazotropha lotti]